MKIQTMFTDLGRTVYSFEVFPPKKDQRIESIYDKLEDICACQPDFISVTYGAGGGGNSNRTAEIAARIKNVHGVEAAAHLTCLYNSKEDVDYTLADLKEKNLENLLCLRGDINPDFPPKDDFHHADELVAYIAGKGGFDLAGACYPEVHPNSANEIEDVLNLKKKVDAGVTHLISQLFFDNESFYRFRERTQLAGINVPLEAGIMPVMNRGQIERMVTMCGASIPAKLSRMMIKWEDPQDLREAGIAYAVDQILDLIAAGVDGIHLYTMNNPDVAAIITDAVHNLL